MANSLDATHTHKPNVGVNSVKLAPNIKTDGSVIQLQTCGPLCKNVNG